MIRYRTTCMRRSWARIDSALFLERKNFFFMRVCTSKILGWASETARRHGQLPLIDPACERQVQHLQRSVHAANLRCQKAEIRLLTACPRTSHFLPNALLAGRLSSGTGRELGFPGGTFGGGGFFLAGGSCPA